MYYGLCVLKERTPNVIRTIMDNYCHYGSEIQHRIVSGLDRYGDRATTTTLLEDLLRKPQGLSDNGVVAALDIYRQFTGRDFADASMHSGRGMFVIGFTHRGLTDESQLKEKLLAWMDDEKGVANFVVRIADRQPVGVGLVRGIGNREKVDRRIGASDEAQLFFSETFAPAVLRSRQLREFASALPGGLPEQARPNYAAIPGDETFAWNATDGYQPPDYVAYFPDDPAAARRLDELYLNRDATELTAREQLHIVRQGLRHSELVPNVLSWAPTISGWPADPMTKEILYHAADPKAPYKTRHASIYYGLSGWWKKPPNVLRLFADIVLSDPYDHSLGSGTLSRIAWSLRDEEEKKIVAGHLDRGLRDHARYSPEKLDNVTEIYQQLTDRKPLVYDEYKDRGMFFVGLLIRRSPSAQTSRSYATDLLGKERYFVDALVSDPKMVVMVVVRGRSGMDQALQKLEADDGVSLVGAGPLAMFKNVDPNDDASVWLDKVKKYLE
jgi:hypothetical protein